MITRSTGRELATASTWDRCGGGGDRHQDRHGATRAFLEGVVATCNFLFLSGLFGLSWVLFSVVVFTFAAGCVFVCWVWWALVLFLGLGEIFYI